MEKKEFNKELIEKKIGEILKEGMGIDWENNPHLKETPKRVSKVYCEIYEGYYKNPEQYIKTFPAPKQGKDNQIIMIGPIKTYSVCSHHMLPFNMDIYIGYIPNDIIMGISKFERISKNICRKLQVQENITEEIADFVDNALNPEGVIVLIKNSNHLCMAMRGVETKSAHVTTSAVRGLFKDDTVKEEFLKLIE